MRHASPALLRILPIVLAIACAPSSMPAGTGRPVPGADAGPGSPGPTGMPPAPTPPPPGPTDCGPIAGVDGDGDGFPAGIDCNDCSAQINPGAFDSPANGFDEDCDGADAAPTDCDVGLPINPGNAEDAARAIGLCRFVASGEAGWGVISARFTTADGSSSPRSMGQVGVLPRLGAVDPAQGASLLAISTGIARDPSQPGFTSECDHFGIDSPDYPGDRVGGEEAFPPGFPVPSPSCPGVPPAPVFNSVAFEVRIRVPTNARGFHFNSNFFTTEYPNYICQEFNDFFVALQQDGGGPLQNIVFDTAGNAVSVNNGLLRACEPGTHGGKYFDCPLGRGMLSATGYDGTVQCGIEEEYPGGPPAPSEGAIGGATGWLRTTARATGGQEITLRFAIWDSGDPDLDSLALIDGFEWELSEIDIDHPETIPDPLI